MREKKSVILPGSYDPVTVGHLDIIKRASERFEEVYAVIFINPDKTYSFSLEERVKMLMLATEELDNVRVSYSLGYVIDYMRDHGIEKIIKGYRNDADLEYEKVQADYNLKMGGYQTEFWLSDEKYSDVSSSTVREMIKNGQEPQDLLVPSVWEFIKRSKE